jgi:hypothetical protein
MTAIPRLLPRAAPGRSLSVVESRAVTLRPVAVGGGMAGQVTSPGRSAPVALGNRLASGPPHGWRRSARSAVDCCSWWPAPP